jgi:hypothetical protein
LIALHVELFSIYYIQSSTSFHDAIEYGTRGWIYGEAHHFKVTVSHISQLKTPTIIESQWSGESTIKKDKRAAEAFLNIKKIHGLLFLLCQFLNKPIWNHKRYGKKFLKHLKQKITL